MRIAGIAEIAVLAVVGPLLSGCIVGTVASTAVDIVTLPVKAVSKTADVLTTSQSEADERRGRAIREQEAREGKAARAAEKARRRHQAEQPEPDWAEPQA